MSCGAGREDVVAARRFRATGSLPRFIGVRPGARAWPERPWHNVGAPLVGALAQGRHETCPYVFFKAQSVYITAPPHPTLASQV